MKYLFLFFLLVDLSCKTGRKLNKDLPWQSQVERTRDKDLVITFNPDSGVFLGLAEVALEGTDFSWQEKMANLGAKIAEILKNEGELTKHLNGNQEDLMTFIEKNILN